MSTRISAYGLLAFVAWVLTASPLWAQKVLPVASAEFKIKGPFTHKNLTVYVIHGKDHYKGAKFITLDEALRSKKAIVVETGDVGQLTIENVTGDVHIYIQSGDIVKGGKQDRTLAGDMIVPPKSGKLPIQSFCVEQGRWSQRGLESAGHFSGSMNQLASKDLKLAARYKMSQGEVWSKVAEAQEKLGKNVGGSVQSADSQSSLQLTLEDKKVQQAAQEYSRELGKAIDGQDDAIGYAFAINGQFNSADIYGSRELFVKLWPKLLDAMAVEALSEFKPGAQAAAPTAVQIQARLTAVEDAQSKEQNASERVSISTRETAKDVLFETRDRANQNSWVRRSYLSK